MPFCIHVARTRACARHGIAVKVTQVPLNGTRHNPTTLPALMVFLHHFILKKHEINMVTTAGIEPARTDIEGVGDCLLSYVVFEQTRYPTRPAGPSTPVGPS